VNREPECDPGFEAWAWYLGSGKWVVSPLRARDNRTGTVSNVRDALWTPTPKRPTKLGNHPFPARAKPYRVTLTQESLDI
jgi:hypothetical protein